jgi:hypothetical protein
LIREGEIVFKRDAAPLKLPLYLRAEPTLNSIFLTKKSNQM